MNYTLSRKNAAGKWWQYGDIKKNKWGNLQASLKVSALEELIELAKSENKEWVNLSMFENTDKPKQAQQTQEPQESFATEELDDTIPF